VDQIAPHLASYLERWAPALVFGSVMALTHLLITVLVLFYFFRDKRHLAGDVSRLSAAVES
jgi:hypothetical protein